ncbi:zinc finger CCHC domain-containing protein 24-like [Cydia amplana]|uniref:zinc finger CCHC domain-containing protein 24-like n=1 Tax=Cydia amplana TaxID=1869771 RepID=UPI002FE696F1
MGSLFSKNSTWRRCRHCDRNVKLFERMCCLCAAAALRMEPPARGSDKPLFGEYLCITCEIVWTSRLCWPSHYQACKRCHQLVYPHTWRDLTAAEIRREATTKDHQREYCQKCLEVGYYCGDYARLYGKL